MPEYDYAVMLSGGKGSWGAARYLIDEHGADPARMVLVFTDTNGEDPDLYRFLVECAANLAGISMGSWGQQSGEDTAEIAVEFARTHLPNLLWLDNDGRTIWDVFRKSRMIGNTRLSVCSRQLKQKPARDWLEANTDPEHTKVVVGIDWTESHRLPAITRNYQPWTATAPLTEPGAWSRERIAKELAAAGIAEPRLYAMGFEHNNCAGACVRAGQGQWARLLEQNRSRYMEEEAQENAFRADLGKDVAILRDRRGGVTKPLPLTVLRHRIDGTEPGDVDMDDIGGCGCMTDLEMEEDQ